jgi:hypothetical protein
MVLPSVPGTRQTVPITPVSLTAGNVYWVAFQSDGTQLPTCTDGGTATRYYLTTTWGDFQEVAPVMTPSTVYPPVGYANSCP